MNYYRFYHAGKSKSYSAYVRRCPTCEIFDSSTGTSHKRYLPGEISFQWKSDSKRRGDINSVTSYWPVVSSGFKDFIQSKSYTGVTFYDALDIPSANGPRHEPLGSPGTWWVIAPSTYELIDMDIFCGQHFKYDKGTTLLSEHKMPGASIVAQRKVRPLSEPKTDFFGIADMKWYPALYCNQNVADELIRKKFINLYLEPAS